MESVLSDPVLAFLLSHNTTISLCLYQMVNTSLSPLRVIRFTLQYATLLLEYFATCNSSDILHDCHDLLSSAVNTCQWETCTPSTRRDICLFLSRVQRPNHMQFFGGLIILRRYMFLSVLRVSYSFVNFMQIQRVNKFEI